jgi:quercetin 2,3-dioxygenase
MITSRKSADRVPLIDHGRRGWTSFDGPEPGFRSLHSLREEELAPGAAFPIDTSRELEILTYVRDGALILLDSAGRTISLEAGECHRTVSCVGEPQKATNASLTETARVFQVRFLPDHSLLRTPPEKRRFSKAQREGILRLLGSRGGRNGSLRLRQDVDVYSSLLDPGRHVVHELAAGRGAWLHVVDGLIQTGDQYLESGDGMAVVDEPAFSLIARRPSEILLFDVR